MSCNTGAYCIRIVLILNELNGIEIGIEIYISYPECYFKSYVWGCIVLKLNNHWDFIEIAFDIEIGFKRAYSAMHCKHIFTLGPKIIELNYL